MLCGSHIKIWNLANHMKKQNKKHKMLDLLAKHWKLWVWCSLFHFFHVNCKIPNFNMWTASFLYWVDFTNLWVFFSELVPAGFLAASLCFFKKSIVAKSTVVLSIFLWAAAAAAAAAAELPEVWPPPSSEAWVRILCFISTLRQSNWHLWWWVDLSSTQW